MSLLMVVDNFDNRIRIDILYHLEIKFVFGAGIRYITIRYDENYIHYTLFNFKHMKQKEKF